MIEIDLAPAPTSSPSSASASRGAAEEFASALQEAGGRGDGAPCDRAAEAPGRDDHAARERTPESRPTERPEIDRSADDPTDRTDAASEADTADAAASADGADETVIDGVAENGPEQQPVVTLPMEVLTPSAPAPVEAGEPVVAADTEAEAEAEGEVAAVAPAVLDAVAPDAAADGAPVAVAEVIAGADEAPSATDGVEELETEVASPISTAGDAEAGVAGDTETVEAFPSSVETGEQLTTAALKAEAATVLAAAPVTPDPVATAGTDASIGERDIAISAAEPAAQVAVAAEPAAEVAVAAEPAVEVAVAAEPAAEVAVAAERSPSAPNPTPAAPGLAAVPAAEATAAAVAEVVTPTQVSTPAAGTTVDPLAAADAAAVAEIDVPTPPQQIAEALRDVRRMTDGSHRLSLQLHPEELGVVQLEVAVRDGQLHLRAATELDSTRRLLNASLPELRAQLADAGVSAGSLEVGAETAGEGRSTRDNGASSTTRSGFDESVPNNPSGVADAATPTAPGRLDVRL